jgi:hypothetical protein
MTTFLTDDMLREIEKRCAAATSGPWVSYVEGRDHQSGSNIIKTGAREGRRRGELEILGASPADQDFIAHARQDVPLLLAEIQRLRLVCR